MVEVVMGLEVAGLVVRHPHPSGGRALQADLTPAGRTALHACRLVMAATEARLLAGLAPQELTHLHELLERCLVSFRSSGTLRSSY
jgi:DNA-binding MarR family transcriptional regulator